MVDVRGEAVVDAASGEEGRRLLVFGGPGVRLKVEMMDDVVVGLGCARGRG